MRWPKKELPIPNLVAVMLMAALPALVLSIWNVRGINRKSQPSVFPEAASTQGAKS
jgi:hypothetical protein